jgi:hypothetical protein
MMRIVLVEAKGKWSCYRPLIDEEFGSEATK